MGKSSLCFLAAAALVFNLISLPRAAAQAPIQYHYDEVGRLVGVTDGAGNSAAYRYDPVGNILQVSRATSAQVSLFDFAPGSGVAGDVVTVSGAGFSAAAAQNSVSFNGLNAAVVSATPTRIVAVVPSGATTGPIAVLTPAGGATSVDAFVVGATLAPTISSFRPVIGVAGTVVAVTGTNYATSAGANKLAFNGRAAHTDSDSASSFTAIVPPSSSSGKIVVATAYGIATSVEDFFVPPVPYSPAEFELTDRMSIGQSKTLTIMAAGKKGMILFDGSAGQKISLVLSGVTISGGTVTLLAPNGASIGSTTLSSSGRFIDTLALPASGTYTILINPSASARGSVTLAINAIQAVTGSISIGGAAATVATGTPGQNAELKFNALAGQRISLNMTAVSATLGCPAVSIVKPDGSVLVAFANYSCSTSYFFDAATLPLSGEYTIAIDPQKASTGSASFTLYNIPPETSATINPDGPAVTLTTSVPGENASLIFSGTTGQRISVNITAVATSLNCPSFAILKPDGGNLVGPDISCGSTYFIDTTALPADGVYKIVMDPRLMTTGSATFKLFFVPNDVDGVIAPGGAAVKLTTSVPGQGGVLSFTGIAAQKISMNVTAIASSLGCTKFSIVKPDGSNQLAPTTACGATFFADAATLPLGGIYTVIMNPSAAGTGSATFALYEVLDASGAILVGAAPTPVSITVPGQNVDLSFSGSEGQKITVRITGNTVGCQVYSLRRPDGSVQASTTSCSANVNMAQQTLAASGSYSIRMDPSGAKTGNFNVAITSP